jgi:type VI secretion system protein ImpM
MTGAAPGEGFAAGWYGKIPGTGDFIARRLPPAFREPWDRWLRDAIDGSRRRLGAAWRDAFLSMPPWRFALGPGVLGANAWAGLMVPSVDAVGRYFPLTVACALPGAGIDAAATLLSAHAWFDEIEAIALTAIAPAADAGEIDAALARRRFEARWLALPAAGASSAGCAWLAEASEVFDRKLLLCERLPSAEQFCAMMDGRWADHGWGS